MNKMPSFFKSSKPKRFAFSPRYYDEDKAQLEARIKRIRSELKEADMAKNDDDLRLKFRNEWRKNSNISASNKATYRVFIIASILGILAYLYLKY